MRIIYEFRADGEVEVLCAGRWSSPVVPRVGELVMLRGPGATLSGDGKTPDPGPVSYIVTDVVHCPEIDVVHVVFSGDHDGEWDRDRAAEREGWFK